MIGPPPSTDDVAAINRWLNDLYEEYQTYGFPHERAVIDLSVENVSTSGTGEDDLSTTTIPVNFYQNHRGITVLAAGVKANSNGNKTIKFYFGATTFTVFPATNDTADWAFEATILFEDYNSQRIYWMGGGSVEQYHVGTEDMSAGSVEIKITGECANAGDTVTQTMWLLKGL